jgi:hypothetical protein
MLKIIILLSFTIFFIGCDLECRKLAITNKSEYNIFYTIDLKKEIFINDYLYEIKPSDTVLPLLFRGTNILKEHDKIWIDYINLHSKDSTLHIFIFKDSKISDEIIKNKDYKRIDLKVKDLEAINWTYVYEDEGK